MKKLRELLSKKSENQPLRIDSIKFLSNKKTNEEYFEVSVIDANSDVSVIKSEKKNYLYNWKKMLDLNIYEGDKAVYDELIYLTEILKNHGIDEFIEIFIGLQSELPFLWVLVNDIYQMVEAKDVYPEKLQVVENRLNILMDKFEKYQKYIYESLIEPYENAKIIDPLRLLFGYEMFLSAGSQESILAYAVFYNAQRYGSFDVKESFLSMINEEGNVLCFEMPNVYEIDDYIDKTIFDIFDDIFLSGMHYLIEMEQIPKKCKLCGRYFLNKYSYVANYCNVQYRDTKDTCQEYVAKMKYKAKVSKNVINTEYSKVYNRIYSRVRRGNLSKEDAKFNELKELRDSFSVKYEMSNNEYEKETFIKTFIIEANRLYATHEMKEDMLKKLGISWDSIEMFNSMAKDNSLDEFKEALVMQKEIISSDDYLMQEINRSFKELADRLNEEQWLEVQCALPLDEFFT